MGTSNCPSLARAAASSRRSNACSRPTIRYPVCAFIQRLLQEGCPVVEPDRAPLEPPSSALTRGGSTSHYAGDTLLRSGLPTGCGCLFRSRFIPSSIENRVGLVRNLVLFLMGLISLRTLGGQGPEGRFARDGLATQSPEKA